MNTAGLEYSVEKLNIGIVGMGLKGGLAYSNILALGPDALKLRVDRVRLFDSDPGKAEKWAENAEDQNEMWFESSVHPIKELPDFLDRIDLLLITASSEKKKGLKKVTKANHSILSRITPLISPDYKGLVIVASDQADALCYQVAVETGMNPLMIAGFNDMDRARAESLIRMEYEGEDFSVEACVAGPQYRSVLLGSKTTINIWAFEEYRGSKTALANINSNLRIKSDEVLANPDIRETAGASRLVELIKSIANSEGYTTLSTLYPLGNQGLYIGMPAFFYRMQPVIKSEDLKRSQIMVANGYSLLETIERNEWLESMPAREKKILTKLMEDQIQFINKTGEWADLLNLDDVYYSPIFEETESEERIRKAKKRKPLVRKRRRSFIDTAIEIKFHGAKITAEANRKPKKDEEKN